MRKYILGIYRRKEGILILEKTKVFMVIKRLLFINKDICYKGVMVF